VSFDFKNLIVYQKAKKFHNASMLEIKRNKFPDYSKNQLSRASFSIALNIAEGSGRFSRKDRRNFFVIARSSLLECIAIFDILSDQNYISKSRFQQIEDEADEISRMLFSLIRKLE